MNRRNFIVALAVAAAAWPFAVHAQTYPARPVTMVVPFAAGGTFDAMAAEAVRATRAVAMRMVASFFMVVLPRCRVRDAEPRNQVERDQKTGEGHQARAGDVEGADRVVGQHHPDGAARRNRTAEQGPRRPQFESRATAQDEQQVAAFRRVAPSLAGVNRVGFGVEQTVVFRWIERAFYSRRSIRLCGAMWGRRLPPRSPRSVARRL